MRAEDTRAEDARAEDARAVVRADDPLPRSCCLSEMVKISAVNFVNFGK